MIRSINRGKRRAGGFIAEIEITNSISGSSTVLTTQNGSNFPVITSTDGDTSLVFTSIPSAEIADTFLVKRAKQTCFNEKTYSWPKEWLWNGNTGNDMTFELEIPDAILGRYCGIRTVAREIVSAVSQVEHNFAEDQGKVGDYKDNVIVGLIAMNLITIIGGCVLYKNVSKNKQVYKEYAATAETSEEDADEDQHLI